MNKIKNLISYFLKHEFIRFLIIGGIATIIDWSIFYLLSIKLGIYYQIALTISFMFALLFNFTLSKLFTFRNKSKNHLKQYGVYFFVSLVSLLLSMSIMYMFVDILVIDKMVSKVITTGIMLFVNYFSHKNISFKF